MLSYLKSCFYFIMKDLFGYEHKNNVGCDVVRGAGQELFSDDLWEHNSSCRALMS